MRYSRQCIRPDIAAPNQLCESEPFVTLSPLVLTLTSEDLTLQTGEIEVPGLTQLETLVRQYLFHGTVPSQSDVDQLERELDLGD